MTIKCHEFFECEKKECTMFREAEKRDCWDIEPTSTSCTNILPETVKVGNKLFHCHNCQYYKHVHSANNGLVKIMRLLKNFLSGLR